AMETALQAVPAARAAGNLAALIMAAVHALANHFGHRLANHVRLHDRALFDGRDHFANLARLDASLGAPLVAGDGPRVGLGDALAAIRRVSLRLTLSGVDRPCRGVVLGHPLLHANGAVLRGAGVCRHGGGARWLGSILGPRGPSRRGYDTASQQGNANMLPNH